MWFNIYIFLMVLFLGIFNYIGLSFSGDFDKKTYILLSMTPLFSSCVLFAACLFLSTFTHKTKRMIGISLGLVFGSYILQILAGLAEEVEFLKYFSIFTLADIRNVIQEVTINPMMILISIILTISFLVCTSIRYNKKELI